MYLNPIIAPLDLNGTLYAIQDDQGMTIGTGTREVCEVLLQIIKEQAGNALIRKLPTDTKRHLNVRSAIAI